VSEIADRTVEIRAIAREAGHRTKIAVWSKDDKVDPVGACVGLRGARVKNIVRELNNEKVDIIRWSEDPRDIVEEALKPAVIRSITVDEEKRIIHVTVSEEDLSKAIGRRGQNARLTSRLIDWDVQVRRDESQQKMFDDRINNAAHNLGTSLGLNDDLAEKLFRSGGISLDLVVEMPADYIADSLGIPQHEADDILSKAQALLG
jgi:N utilization substance protein A